MLLTTQYKNSPIRYYSYETEEQHKAALLAIMKNGWKHFPTNQNLEVNEESVRHHFTVEEWEMATLRDSIFDVLPPMMKAKIATVKMKFATLMGEQTRRFKTMRSARNLIQASKEDALTQMVTVNGEEKLAIFAVTAKLNDMFFNDYGVRLFSTQETEDY